MSEVHNTPTAAAPLEHAVEPTTTATAPGTQEIPAVAESTPSAAPTTTATDAVKPEESLAAPVTDKVDETPAVAPVEELKESKAAEPVSEGQLGYKAPGLLKQFTFSKKEFWLSDSPVTPQHLDSYLRGEKAEVSHPIVAWASQTGKGLLFFNKKSETTRTHPAGVLALYDATDLKKSSPHEFSFELHGHKHQFKAANDAERDGWYLSLEKAIELGKASKESVRAGDAYKSEIEKLNTPNTIGAAGIASKARNQSQPKKSTDVAEPERTGSSEGEDEALKKNTKSRSTSRGVLNRLKGKKDEAEAKHEIKKEEKEEAKEEKKIEKEEIKAEKEAEKHGEVAPGTAVTAGALATSAPLDAHTTAERALGSPVAENKVDEPVEALPTAATTETPKVEEKPKVSKRGSIFGKLPGAWNSIKSPTKEKDLKDAELKPEVPPKDVGVSETAPQLPETTTTTEPIEPAAPAVASTEATKPEITEPATAIETPKTSEVLTPGKEKKNFLSGLGFLNKRDRSVSPSAVKETPAKTETPAVAPVAEESAPIEPVKAEEHAFDTPVAAAAPIEPTTAEPIEEPKTTTTAEATSPGAKRQSVFGNLGRRASKALNRIQTPKKENAAPTTATETKAADETVPSTTTDKVADKTVEPSATAPTIEENKPETVGINSTTPVAASA